MLVIRNDGYIELVKLPEPNTRPTTGIDLLFGKAVPPGFAFWAYDSRGRWRRTPKKKNYQLRFTKFYR